MTFQERVGAVPPENFVGQLWWSVAHKLLPAVTRAYVHKDGRPLQWNIKETAKLWDVLVNPLFDIVHAELPIADTVGMDSVLETPAAIGLRIDLLTSDQQADPRLLIQLHYPDRAPSEIHLRYPGVRDLGGGLIRAAVVERSTAWSRGVADAIGCGDAWRMLPLPEARFLTNLELLTSSLVAELTAQWRIEVPAEAYVREPSGARALASAFKGTLTRASANLAPGVSPTLCLAGAAVMLERMFEFRITSSDGHDSVTAELEPEIWSPAPPSFSPGRAKQSARRPTPQSLHARQLAALLPGLAAVLGDLSLEFRKVHFDGATSSNEVHVVAETHLQAPVGATTSPTQIAPGVELHSGTLEVVWEAGTESCAATLEGLYKLPHKDHTSRFAIDGVRDHCVLRVSRLPLDGPLSDSPRFGNFAEAVAAIPRFDQPELRIPVSSGFTLVHLPSQHELHAREEGRGFVGWTDYGGSSNDPPVIDMDEEEKED